MFRAMIFDLDGTLVQTEKLKAISYARAAVELCPTKLNESAVIEAFKEVVGLSRREVATALVKRFGLAEPAGRRMEEFGVTVPWQAFVQLRLRIYGRMLDDPQVLIDNQWPHNMALLREARRTQCRVGLATMSYCSQVRRVLQVLEITDQFDFVASREDVEEGKPDPEIYLLVAEEFNIPAASCLVIEDSPAGVRAALAAGMKVVAVSTPFTHRRLHQSQLLSEDLIVDNGAEVHEVVARVIGQFQDR